MVIWTFAGAGLSDGFPSFLSHISDLPTQFINVLVGCAGVMLVLLLLRYPNVNIKFLEIPFRSCHFSFYTIAFVYQASTYDDFIRAYT